MRNIAAHGDAILIHPLFEGSFGFADPLRSRDPAAAIAEDCRLDEALGRSGWAGWLRSLQAALPARNVLVVLTGYPGPSEAHQSIAEGMRSRHHVHVHIDSRADVTRFAKVNEAMRTRGDGIDWLLIADDDIALCRDFLGTFIDTAEAAGLVIAQPAHRIHSHASFAVTQRKPRSIVRSTHFVEIGPLAAIHRSVFWKLIPFPETRFGWGVDFLWADWARSVGWKMGIVDATPIEHLRPVNSTYSRDDSIADASELLFRHAPAIGRAQMFADDRIMIGW